MANTPDIPTRYDHVYWVEVDKVSPNPFQPRKEFDEEKLKSLADSIRQYGILQPLTVTRADVEKPDGGIESRYELIAGERRLRASKLLGLREVPVVIRVGEESNSMKLQLAIIENLQREDLNAIDRAKALAQLVQEFGLSHGEVGEKMGKSREFVSNSIRLLALPEEIQQAVLNKDISEGHARALLMLSDKPEEQKTLFKEIVLKKTSVRVTEQLARRIAVDKIRKLDKTAEMLELEKSLAEALGTRVFIQHSPKGGRINIEFYSAEDLAHIVAALGERHESTGDDAAEVPVATEVMPVGMPSEVNVPVVAVHSEPVSLPAPETLEVLPAPEPVAVLEAPEPVMVIPAQAPQAPEEDLYSVKNFTV